MLFLCTCLVRVSTGTVTLTNCQTFVRPLKEDYFGPPGINAFYAIVLTRSLRHYGPLPFHFYVCGNLNILTRPQGTALHVACL